MDMGSARASMRPRRRLGSARERAHLCLDRGAGLRRHRLGLAALECLWRWPLWITSPRQRCGSWDRIPCVGLTSCAGVCPSSASSVSTRTFSGPPRDPPRILLRPAGSAAGRLSTAPSLLLAKRESCRRMQSKPEGSTRSDETATIHTSCALISCMDIPCPDGTKQGEMPYV